MSVNQDKKALKDWGIAIDLLRRQTEIRRVESKQAQKDRITRAKKEYAYFVQEYLPMFAKVKTPPWHIKAANTVLKNSEISLWLKWGRGLAKSVVADVTIPLWLWINNDIKFFVLIGQNETKAEILLDDLRMQFEGNQRLIYDFGEQKTQGHWSSGFFITQNGFICKSLGMGQDPRGLRIGGDRPDFIVCDDWETKDTLKNPKRQDEYANWLLTSIIPTMDGERQRVLLAQNGFAPRMIFTKIIDENSGWRVMNQPAFYSNTLLPIWKEKYKPDYYKKKIQTMGILHAKAEYNNDPHVEGKIFTDDMINWGKLPRLDSFDAIIGRWDVAFAGTSTSDHNAVRVWGLKDGRKWLIDCFVKQSKLKPAIEWIADFQLHLPKSVSVQFKMEKQFWNDEIDRTITEIEKEKGLNLNIIKAERSTKKKYDRMLEMHPQYQNNRIFYNEKLKDHNDTKVGLSQLKGLEPGYKTHDDAPDADKEAFDDLDSINRTTGRTHRTGKRQSQSY